MGIGIIGPDYPGCIVGVCDEDIEKRGKYESI